MGFGSFFEQPMAVAATKRPTAAKRMYVILSLVRALVGEGDGGDLVHAACQ